MGMRLEMRKPNPKAGQESKWMVSGAPFNSSGACSSRETTWLCCGALGEYTNKWRSPCKQSSDYYSVLFVRSTTFKVHTGWGTLHSIFDLIWWKCLVLIRQSPPTNLHSGRIIHTGLVFIVFVRWFTKQSLFRRHRSYKIQGVVKAGPCPASNLQARDQLSQHRCGPCSHGPAHTAAACP